MIVRVHAVIAALLALGAPCANACAQAAAPPREAIAVGWSPAAGLIGAEFVGRAHSRAPRLGAAVGIGLAGFGGRFNLALRDPWAHTRVPYLGVGYVTTPWLPVIRMSGAASLEGGVQFWPTAKQNVYVDAGAGVARLFGAAASTGPVLRLLVGRAF